MHAQITLSILLYGSESQIYSPSQLTKLNSLHFKALRQIFSIRSSFYHRVLEPSDAQCSNEFLMRMALDHVPRLMTPSQRIISERISYLGHILRHEESLEHVTIFQTAHVYRRLQTRRPGKPRVHWPELTMAEAYQRHQFIQDGSPYPSLSSLDHPLFQHAQRQLVTEYHTPSFGNTQIWRTLTPASHDRQHWKSIVSLR